jgi:hypothetical protein
VHVSGNCESCTQWGEMDSNDESGDSSHSSNSPRLKKLEKALLLLRKCKQLLAPPQPVVNPPPPIPILTGAQWLHIVLADRTRCHEMLRMSRDAFLELHDRLLPFGLESTRECTPREALAVYIVTCAHGTGVRQVKDRFERSLGTVSCKTTNVAQVMFRWGADYYNSFG